MESLRPIVTKIDGSNRFWFKAFGLASVISVALFAATSNAQDSKSGGEEASVDLTSDDGRVIVIGTQVPAKPVPVFFQAASVANATVSSTRTIQKIDLNIQVIQGDPEQIQLALVGDGEVRSVEGEGVRSYAVRTEKKQRFLELQLDPEKKSFKATVQIESNSYGLPKQLRLTHLGPADSVGFDSTINIQFGDGVKGQVIDNAGFVRLQAEKESTTLHTRVGGSLVLDLRRQTTSPDPIEILDAKLIGQITADQKSIEFKWDATIVVNEKEVSLDLLSGAAALRSLPETDSIRLRLISDKSGYRYRATFPKVGETKLELGFVAPIQSLPNDARGVDFRIASGPVVPLEINGLSADISFSRDAGLMSLRLLEESWNGFLPADGSVKMQWSSNRSAGEGKLFFSTSGLIETKVGSGLLRQDHQLSFQVLQGELSSLSLAIEGPGEILDVKGQNLVSWVVETVDDEKRLVIEIGKPVTESTEFLIRSQTALGSFPLQVQGMSLVPVEAIRHSGFLRISNVGSVRLEPTDLTGLTQLSPEQYPGEQMQSRQIFAYRFPSATHGFSVTADRVQPEVNISELIQYELRETEKLIRADIELDIREAPIRDWDFQIPSDYSVVSVTGANVTDYLAATEESDGQRELKVLFGEDISGRQLINVHLEKSQIAKAESWELPRIDHPNAKSVRGDIGIVGAPGYRLTLEAGDRLAEKPLSYFPKPTANLQHAFRMREAEWSASMKIELLDRSIQSDVFHLYSLSEENIYGSALINYFITGAPVSELKIRMPVDLKNEVVDGQDVQDARREEDVLTVTLHQPVMGSYTLLLTYEQKPGKDSGEFSAGNVQPIGVQGERGYVQVVSPVQVEMETLEISDGMLSLDPLELPSEFRLLSSAPTLGAWQYTERPFAVGLKVRWFRPGSTVGQVVEFSEVETTISQDGEQVTQLTYYVKSRGQRSLRVQLPEAPVRLWEVSVGEQGASLEPVTARKAGEYTLIPLPGSTDPNVPVEVQLRFGKASVWETRPSLALPKVDAPILKTQWTITGDERRVLSPAGGTVRLPRRVLSATGFDWVTRNGLGVLLSCLLLTGLAVLVRQGESWWRHMAVILAFAAIYLAIDTAGNAGGSVVSDPTLMLRLPILSAGEHVQLDLYNVPLWRANLSSMGLVLGAIGAMGAFASLLQRFEGYRLRLRVTSLFVIMVAVLLQHGSGPIFYWLVALSVFSLVGIRSLMTVYKSVKEWLETNEEDEGEVVMKTDSPESTALELSESDLPDEDDPDSDGMGPGIGGATVVLLALIFGTCWTSRGAAQTSSEVTGQYSAADKIEQVWQVGNGSNQLQSEVAMRLSGSPGDQFLLLRTPAVLTRFEGEGVKLSKYTDPKKGGFYVVSIIEPKVESQDEDNSQDPPAESGSTKAKGGNLVNLELSFSYQLEAFDKTNGINVLTGDATVNRLEVAVKSDEYEISCSNSVSSVDLGEAEPAGGDPQGEAETRKSFVLAPGAAIVKLAPRSRDLTLEETKFFVETANLYLPKPGVVDGVHRLDLRASQGVLDSLSIEIPSGLTVSQVTGPVASWQFDADEGLLILSLAPAQSQPFSVSINTQRGLDPLPTELELSPIRVRNANGEVGLVAVAFDGDAQPEKIAAEQLSLVNIGDFDAKLLGELPASIYRVYRYGAEGGSLNLNVAPVSPEVRVVTNQVLSLGDERVLLAINLSAEITRAGLFKLTFPLPEGFEVESLSGPSLHHWSEVEVDGLRKVIMHLNGKTLGSQNFSLSLTANTPSTESDWELPRFSLEEAVRQTGELVVQPATGIRLRTATRQNISEVDPRSMGSATPGAVAYRLLQADWKLALGVEKLDSRVSGSILVETDLKEGQTKSSVIGNFEVQNASIRSMRVRLPLSDPEEVKMLRASGAVVSDLVPLDQEQQLWELQFKRRVLGAVNFRIEYERRGDRVDQAETLRLITFPDAGQVNSFFSVRAGGRLEVALPEDATGWNKIDWNSVPSGLRAFSSKRSPIVTMRAQKSAQPIQIGIQRHSLADALKLRVESGRLTSVLSPNGDQLTEVDLQMQVIQRSSLTIGLPEGGEIFSIFVNGESVNSIRLDSVDGGESHTWQFYVEELLDAQFAEVKFIYSVPGNGLSRLSLTSPVLNVPLENIQWSVVAPEGLDLTDHDGNADLVRQSQLSEYDRNSYLRKSSMLRESKKEKAIEYLDKASELIQNDQTKAEMYLKGAANQYGLNDASNEDARVQLEELQTQKAIVGLNSRRQQFFLDNDRDDMMFEGTEQLRQAAANNPILQEGSLNFQLQDMSQLLRGNSSEDNAVLERIAGRLVQHQRTSQPAPQAIVISLPEEGEVYTFSRSVQVAENVPLELDLTFKSRLELPFGRSLFALIIVLLGSAVTVWVVGDRKS